MADIDFHAIEKKWREYWETEKIYSFEKKSQKKIFSIDTPPPTVSGKMRLGHSFSYSQQDFVIQDGERIAQMIIARHEKAEWIEVQELIETQRGAGGFGSTGKR